MGDDPVILVTGAGGQLGKTLARVLPQGRFLDRSELDVTDRVAVRNAVEGTDVVVHLAAMTAVDRCERDRDTAWSINADGTSNVVAAATSSGARVVYLSTDYVFAGVKDEYAEYDQPRPLNHYGRSKLEGEKHVLRLGPRGLVVRTSWLIGPGRNFVKAILQRAREGEEVRVVADQVGRPTFSEPLADALVQLIEDDLSGIVHVAGDGAPCSWADLADSALAAARLDIRVRRVSTAEHIATMPRPSAIRPPRSVLALDKARSLGLPLVAWRESLHAYLETSR